MIITNRTFIDNEKYYLMPLSMENIAAAKKLCDISVGENLYGEEALRRAAVLQDHLFYLLYDGEREAGYFYCFAADAACVAEQLKLGGLSGLLFENEQEIVGVFQSVGLLPEYKKSGLAVKMIRYFEKQLFERYKVNKILVPSWKQGSFIPAEGPLTKCGFTYLGDVERAWFEIEELKCPYCKEKSCICDAAIFYKAGEGFDKDI